MSVRGFALADGDTLPSHPGPCLLAEPTPKSELTRALFAKLDDPRMRFLEDEMRRRRLPGQKDVPKGTVIIFAIELYREMVQLSGNLVDRKELSEADLQSMLTLLRRCQAPIYLPRLRRLRTK